MNTCATAIIGTWVESPNVCKTSASICRCLCGIKPVKNKNNQNAKINQLILYYPVTGRLEIICYTSKNVHLITKTINFLFFLTNGALDNFYLSVLKSISITLCKPNLCRQKDFVYKHKLSVQVKKVFFLVPNFNIKLA